MQPPRHTRPDGRMVEDLNFGRQNFGSVLPQPTRAIKSLELAAFTVERVFPLPANKQRGLLRNSFYTVYSFVTLTIRKIIFRKLVKAPRFAVLAVKAPEVV
jgi:hypothetical protein